MNHDEAHDDLDELPARPRQVIPSADRELLELAGRALGAVQVEDVEGENWLNLHFADGSTVFHWNPLVHGDDTFELGVKLKLFEGDATFLMHFAEEQNLIPDRIAAARRAAVRAAAETSCA